MRLKKAHSSSIAAASLASLLLISGCTTINAGSPDDIATTSEAVQKAVTAGVEQALAASQSSQAIVGVWLPDGSAYVRGWGGNTNAATEFYGAQTTAVSMCALALELAAEGKIALTDKVAKHVKRQANIDKITVADLCTGNSGFANFPDYLANVALETPARPWHETELFSEALAHSPLPHRGKDHYLSDSNYLLLSRLGRIVTGESTADLVNKRIFEKAELENTRYWHAKDTSKPANLLQATAYAKDAEGLVCKADPQKIQDVSPAFLSAAGASSTTVTDLKKLYTAYFDGKYGNAKLLKQISEPHPLVHPERDAKGVITKEVPAVAAGEIPHSEIAAGVEKIGPLYGRSGWLPGMVSAVYHDPKTDFTVAVALNNSSGGAAIAKYTALLLAASVQPKSVQIPWTTEAAAAALQASAVCQPEPAPEQ